MANFFDKVVQGVDAVSTLPKKIQNRADELNDRIIRFTRNVQDTVDRAGQTVETNLTENKVRGVAAKAGSWLSKPRNILIAGVGLILLIFLIRKI